MRTTTDQYNYELIMVLFLKSALQIHFYRYSVDARLLGEKMALISRLIWIEVMTKVCICFTLVEFSLVILLLDFMFSSPAHNKEYLQANVTS